MTPILAFAVNHKNYFEMKYFGQVDKYLIYEWTDGNFTFKNELKNPYVNVPTNHINPVNGKKFVDFIKQEGINILVSKKFGQNIKLANSDFVPIITNLSTPDELLPFMKSKMKWIVEELKTNKGNYKLFDLSNGTIKTPL